MASIVSTSSNKDTQNWLRGAFAVLVAKQGLGDFVTDEIVEFREDILTSKFTNKSLAARTLCTTCTTANVLPCPTQNFCPEGQRCNVHDVSPNQPCPTLICQDIRDGISREHVSRCPSWKNTDATKWCSDAFEIAKCFMAPDGYTSVTSLAETDFDGTLTVIMNNKRFQNKMAAPPKLSNICNKAREVGHLIRHSPNMALSDTELENSIDILIDLLSDPKYLAADLKAQEAVAKLKKVKSNTLTISLADIATVIHDALEDTTSRQRETALQTINAESDEAKTKNEEKAEMSLKLLNVVKDMLVNFQDTTTTRFDQLASKLSTFEEFRDVESKQRKRLEQIPESSDDNVEDNASKGYYDYNGEKGYLLVLNATDQRDGTEADIKKLNEFFRDMLHFKVYDPRSKSTDDLSKREVFAEMLKVRNELDNSYYCFICVIMSHGNEDGIKTKDQCIHEEDIREYFNNKNTAKFTGRPKIFLIQACRGVRKDLLCFDSADSEKKFPSFSDPQLPNYSIPTDADTLLAFSTTPGFVSVRSIDNGTWFIGECIEVFKKYHKRIHFEDMLITMRQRVADMKTEDGIKQMPCVWSTLTRRLMLRECKS